MKKENKAADHLTGSLSAGKALRRKAEKVILEKTLLEYTDTISQAEVKQLLHELRVHQIELEMQNEELLAAQEVLDASRARYLDLYDFAPVGYITVSHGGIILEANLTAATLLGKVRSELVKRPIEGFILREDRDIYYLHSKKLFESGDPRKCELRLLKKDGSIFWARLDGIAIMDAVGTRTCRMVMGDITEQRRVEAEKADFEARNLQFQKVKKGSALLLIEDDEMVRNMAKTMLIRLGYTVIEARDGVEAVEIFQERQHEICCVLSDLTMPRMDGWETLTQLRRIRADVPVVLASGYDKEKVMEGDHPELPQVFLTKPYAMVELKEALAKAMNLW